MRPWGLYGGQSGRARDVGFQTTDGKVYTGIEAGNRLTWDIRFRGRGFGMRRGPPQPAGSKYWFETAGGGGWGDALDRDPENVRWDVQSGKVSVERALSVYGVKLGYDEASDTYRVNHEATNRQRLRAKIGIKGR